MNTRKSLAWSFSQQFGQYILQFAASMVIARLLTPSEMGVFALAMAANSLISSLRDFGVGSYLVREETLNQDKIRTAFGMWLALSWTLALLVLVIRHPVAALYDTPGIAGVMLLLSVSFFITPFGQPAQALLMREMRFDILHHIVLASTILGTATSIILAFLGFSYMALAWGMVAGTAGRVILLLAVRRDHLKLVPGFRYWRDVMHFGGYLTAAGLAGTINVEGLKFILGGLQNPASIALFERATQIPSIARQALFTPLSRVLFPAFSKDIREGHSIGPNVERLIGATILIIWPAFLTIGIMAVPIVVFLFGENWRTAGEILPYLLLSNAILSALPQPDQILTPHGMVRRLFFLRLTTLSINMALVIIGAMYSLELFAMLRPVQSLFSVTLIYFAIRPYWQTGLRRLAGGYLSAAATAAVCAIPAAAAVLHFGSDVPVWALGAVAITASVLWLSCIFLFRHPIGKDVRSMLPM